MLKAVLFDLDDTLVDRDAAFKACLRETFPDVEQRARIRLADAYGRGCRESLFLLWRELSGESMDQELLSRRLSAHLHADPTLLANLRELRRHYALALVSNGGGQTQRRKLEATALDSVFTPDHTWISAEVGFAKPNPGLLNLACRALGVEPTECLLVGDHEAEDGAAARAAGMPFLKLAVAGVLPTAGDLAQWHERLGGKAV